MYSIIKSVEKAIELHFCFDFVIVIANNIFYTPCHEQIQTSRIELLRALNNGNTLMVLVV